MAPIRSPCRELRRRAHWPTGRRVRCAPTIRAMICRPCAGVSARHWPSWARTKTVSARVRRPWRRCAIGAGRGVPLSRSAGRRAQAGAGCAARSRARAHRARQRFARIADAAGAVLRRRADIRSCFRNSVSPCFRSRRRPRVRSAICVTALAGATIRTAPLRSRSRGDGRSGPRGHATGLPGQPEQSDRNLVRRRRAGARSSSGYRQSTLVVVDEAYQEYRRRGRLEQRAAVCASAIPNLVVTRTFSKAYALAGLRIGYLLADASVVAVLERLRESFNVNGLALAAARSGARRSRRTCERVCRWTRDERAWLRRRTGSARLPACCRRRPISCWSISAAMPRDLEDAPFERGVIVRPMGGYGLPHTRAHQRRHARRERAPAARPCHERSTATGSAAGGAPLAWRARRAGRQIRFASGDHAGRAGRRRFAYRRLPRRRGHARHGGRICAAWACVSRRLALGDASSMALACTGCAAPRERDRLRQCRHRHAPAGGLAGRAGISIRSWSATRRCRAGRCAASSNRWRAWAPTSIADEGGLPPLRIHGGCRSARHRSTRRRSPVPRSSRRSCWPACMPRAPPKCAKPHPTRDYTERMLAGVRLADRIRPGLGTAAGGHRLAATDVVVPADFSSAAFFHRRRQHRARFATCVLRSVGINPRRTGLLAALRLMGADIVESNRARAGRRAVADLRVRHAPLHGIDVPRGTRRRT